MQQLQYSFILSFFLLLTTNLVAQKVNIQELLDSLERVKTPAEEAKLHDKIGYYYVKRDSAKATYHSRLGIKIAKAHNLLKRQGNCYINLGLIESYLQYQQAAINYHDTAYQIFLLANDTSGLIATLSNSGQKHCYLGNCETGIKKYQQAEKWEDPNNLYRLLNIKVNHGICLMECKAYEQCLKLCQASIQSAIDIENIVYQFHFYYLMANSLSALNRSQEALEAFEKARAIAVSEADLDMEVHVLSDRAATLIKLGRYEQAYEDALKCLDLKENQGLMKNDFRVYLNLAEAAKNLGKLEESLAYYQIALPGLEATEDNVILADSYERGAAVYHLVGKDKDAYQLMLKAKSFRDTMFTNEMRQNLQELTTRYETQKIKQELTASNLAIEKERHRNRLTLIASISLLLLSGIGYFFYRGRQRRLRLESEKRKIELEYGLLRAQMNPHFVFNSLNSIQGYFADNQFAKGNEFLGKFSRLIRRVLDQSVAPAILLSEELETLKLYLDVEKIRLKDKLCYDIQVNENIEADLMKVPPLILQPFAENAIWHGIAPKESKGKISIRLEMDKADQFLLIQLEDDGVGLQSVAKQQKISHQSKGIQITKERLGKQGKITIFDKKEIGETGVQVNLKIPIIDYD